MYCTQTDITDMISEAELIALTDDDGAESVDTLILQAVLDDADAEIDAYCGKRYQTPFDPAPAMIKNAAKRIVAYHLYQRRRGADESRQRDYANVIKFLTAIADGKISLNAPAPDEDDLDEDETGESMVFSRDKLFGPDTMADY